MAQKFRYYAKRINEAPLRIVFRKILALIIKRSYWCLYYLKKKGVISLSPKNFAGSVTVMGEIGKDINDTLVDVARTNESFAARSISRSRAQLKGVFPCLSYGNVIIGEVGNWHKDTIHNFEWPNVYFDRIDFVAADERCDVKIPWEISRFQYLLWLAEGYVLDTDFRKDYVAKFEWIVEDWLAFNEPGYGVNWIVSMEVAIRACNLALAAAAFFDCLDERMKRKIIISLHEHANFISRFPEFSDVSGNHYLANLMGTAVIHSCLYGSNAHRSRTAFEKFYQEADRQFEIEGCHLERAPVYHRLCMDMVAIVHAFEARCGEFDPTGKKVLSRALAFCKKISGRSKKLPVLADCDSGHILWFGEDARKFGDVEVIFAVLHEKELANYYVTSNVAWHCAVSRRRPLPNSRVIETVTSAPYVVEASGFLASHNEDIDCIMRVGGHGLKGRANHDHDDALSIWMFYLGRDFVVEKGCHSYTLDPTIRESYIGSLAHNVVQPKNVNRFSSSYSSVVTTVAGAETAETWTSIHEGNRCQMSAALNSPQRSGQPFRYCRRKIDIEKDEHDRVTIEDRWEWRRELASELRWHFSPLLRLKLDESRRDVEIFDENGEALCRMTFKISDLDAVEVFEFNYSESYGGSVPSKGVRVITPVKLTNTVVTNFQFLRNAFN